MCVFALTRPGCHMNSPSISDEQVRGTSWCHSLRELCHAVWHMYAVYPSPTSSTSELIGRHEGDGAARVLSKGSRCGVHCHFKEFRIQKRKQCWPQFSSCMQVGRTSGSDRGPDHRVTRSQRSLLPARDLNSGQAETDDPLDRTRNVLVIACTACSVCICCHNYVLSAWGSECG